MCWLPSSGRAYSSLRGEAESCGGDRHILSIEQEAHDRYGEDAQRYRSNSSKVKYRMTVLYFYIFCTFSPIQALRYTSPSPSPILLYPASDFYKARGQIQHHQCMLDLFNIPCMRLNNVPSNCRIPHIRRTYRLGGVFK